MDNALIHPGGELRIEARGLARIIRGYPIVFNRLSENLGGFKERILPEAIQRTLREGVDLRALFNHNPDHVLGRLSSGTLRVQADADGLMMELTPPSSASAIVESIERRDITGGSFAFHPVGESETWWDYKATPPVRTIRDMVVRELSIVAWPAYTPTSISLRSADLARASMERYRPAGRTVSERLAASERRFWAFREADR
jgi:HK97 family phage prohead protease